MKVYDDVEIVYKSKFNGNILIRYMADRIILFPLTHNGGIIDNDVENNMQRDKNVSWELALRNDEIFTLPTDIFIDGVAVKRTSLICQDPFTKDYYLYINNFAVHDLKIPEKYIYHDFFEKYSFIKLINPTMHISKAYEKDSFIEAGFEGDDEDDKIQYHFLNTSNPKILIKSGKAKYIN